VQISLKPFQMLYPLTTSEFQHAGGVRGTSWTSTTLSSTPITRRQKRRFSASLLAKASRLDCGLFYNMWRKS
jgi:hypothetical protein